MSETPEPRFDRSIVEGPLRRAVWKLAWPTMLQNLIGGLQGIVDHAMVGHFVGYTGNAAIGVSWQIFLVVIVFVSSLYTGMGVLVARFAGAGDAERVNRTVYQAFLTSVALGVFVMAPVGYLVAPRLLELVKATPEVRAEALPYLRTMFVYGYGLMAFFMIGGALRSAGDARTPLRLGVALTALNVVFNVIFIRGLGPIPAMGTAGAAVGTVLAAGLVSTWAIIGFCRGRWVVRFHRGLRLSPDWGIVRALFRFGLPAGVQGVAMNVAGVLMMRYIGSLPQSAQAQAAYAVGYVQLFALITWSSVGLMGAAAAVAGQNLGAGRPDRAARARGRGQDRPRRRGGHRPGLRRGATATARRLRDDGPRGRDHRHAAAPVPERVRILHHRGADLHRRAPGHGRHAQPALHHSSLADRHPAWHLCAAAIHARTAAGRHLAGHPAGPRRALHAQRRPLPTGEMALHRRGRGTGGGLTCMTDGSAKG